ncbi:M48 family metalloprotease [Marinomonas dokdonensis]|uniref:M48 family metalloprotease n=1 Tax=Marinomonas dokdonensis TaxID=328224 RepID=UPI00405583D1
MRLFQHVTSRLTILVFVFTGSFANTSLAETPDIAAIKDERSLSNPSYILGQYWFRKLNGSRALIDFPPAYEYFRDAIATLTPQTRLYNKTVEMTLLNSTQSNAFVIPGNHMFIYSDIMEMINNENMFYGLLSHELAHLELKHYERQKQQSSEELSKALVLIGAGIAAALSGAGGDATTALWLGGIANQAENTLKYSREQEQEADRRGREYLKAAGLPEEGMTQLFQAFFKKALGRPTLEFLSTHPSPNNRLADSLTFEKSNDIFSTATNPEFNYFRASVLAYRAGLNDQPYDYLGQQITDINASNFAKALFSYLINQPERSLTLLSKITDSNLYTEYLKALSLIKTGESDQAIEVIQYQLDLAPKNLLFAALKAQITHTKALDFGTEYLYEKRLIWRANIQFYQHSNNIPMALYYRSLLDFSQGKSKEAQLLIRRSEHEAFNTDKEIIRKASNRFKLIKEAEASQDLKDD